MKDFDLAAAKRGATVCTRNGHPARILAFDLEDGPFCIVAAYKDGEKEIVEEYDQYGFQCVNDDGLHPVSWNDDLMMSDDDYLEKLERGEYDHIGEPTEKVDWDYWRRMYAGMAMQGLMADSEYKMMGYADLGKGSEKFYNRTAELVVGMADALIEELKKKK